MRLLKANEIECRVGQKTKDGNKYSVLLYKTARTDMAILDELYGYNNWQVEYQMVGSSLFCTISIWDSEKKQWIMKQSNGSESNMEAEKGQASDAFKRAGFMVGIGRELYSAPQIWLSSEISPYSLEVSEIGYNEKNEISRLVIKSKGNTVFEFGKEEKIVIGKKVESKIEIPKPLFTPNTAYDTLLEKYKDKIVVNAELKKAGASSLKEITEEIFHKADKALEALSENGACD